MAGRALRLHGTSRPGSAYAPLLHDTRPLSVLAAPRLGTRPRLMHARPCGVPLVPTEAAGCAARINTGRAAGAARAACPARPRHQGGPEIASSVCRAAARDSNRACSWQSTVLQAQRPGHAASAISAAPSERRRPGPVPRSMRGAPAARPVLIRAAQPGASEGSEGSPKRSAGPRMHERVAHGSGVAHKHERERMHERVAHASSAVQTNERSVAHASGTGASSRSIA
jgi:hypothetical protein